MNELPRQKLREIVVKYDPSVWSDTNRCRGLLMDYCHGCLREVNILVAALEVNVPTDLLKVSASKPPEYLVNRLTERVYEKGVDKKAARWAVESWALALEGVTVSLPLRPPPSMPLDPPKSSQPPTPVRPPHERSSPQYPSEKSRPPTSQIRPPRIPISNTLPLGNKLFDYRGHHAIVSAVACSPDGGLVASGDQKGYVHLSNPFAGHTEKIYQESNLPVNHLLWTFDGRLIISRGNDVLIVDPTSGHKRSFAFPASMNKVSLSADGRTLAMAGKDSTVHIGDMQSVQEIRSLKHKAEVLGISWNAVGTELVSVSKDMTCRVYREDTILWEYSEYPGSPFPIPKAVGMGKWAITAVDWSLDGSRIAIGAQNGMLHVLDSSTGKPLASYQEPMGAKAVAWHPNSKVLASLSQTVKVRDEGGTELFALSTPEAVEAFVWYPDGSALITCSGTTVSVWR